METLTYRHSMGIFSGNSTQIHLMYLGVKLGEQKHHNTRIGCRSGGLMACFCEDFLGAEQLAGISTVSYLRQLQSRVWLPQASNIMCFFFQAFDESGEGSWDLFKACRPLALTWRILPIDNPGLLLQSPTSGTPGAAFPFLRHWFLQIVHHACVLLF
jgi:hypothetical protein